MKKAITILILAALLSGCAQSAEPSAEVVTTTSSSAMTSAEIAKTSESVTVAESKTTTTKKTTQTPAVTTTTTSVTTTRTAPTSATERTSRETTQPTESEPVSARCEPVRATAAMTTTTAPITELPRETTTAKQTTTTTTKQTTTTKTTTTTSEKITVPKPTIISKATTTVIENGITYVEVPDITCLATMIENLEETDTPPIYYIQIGHILKHDGTDYGKAVAVFRWMEKNGWGSCVYHSLEAYYVCQGIGLECAYAFCTDNGWYGHTFNVVKVEGEWYALDTQAGIFLDNWPYVCKRMFDGMDRDLPPFDEDAFYPYDEDGEYRDWSIEYVE